jgi:hypothetical protein
MEQYHPKRKRNEIIGEDEKKTLIARGTYITIALWNDHKRQRLPRNEMRSRL